MDLKTIQNKAKGVGKTDLPFGIGTAIDYAAEKATGFAEGAAEMAVGAKKAYTGEDKQIEFPDALEVTDIEMPFFERLAPWLKSMTTRSDFGKVEIIRDTWEKDEKFGGAYVDKFDNPFIIWNEKIHYVNKPGFTSLDFTNVVNEVLKFLPVSKWTQMAATTPKKILRGMVGYSGTEAASAIGEEIVAPETSESKDISDRAKEVGISTGIGVASDVLVPPALRVGGKAIRAATPGVIKHNLPRLTKEVWKTISKSEFPLSKGQAGSLPFKKGEGSPMEQASPQLIKEHMIRTSKGPGADIMSGLDKTQLEKIRLKADKLTDDMGSGKMSTVEKELIPLESATSIKNIVTKRASTMKNRAQNIYQKQNLSELSLTPEGINTFANKSLQEIANLKIGPTEMRMYPTLRRQIDILKRIEKISSKAQFRPKSFSYMRDYQKTLNRVILEIKTSKPNSPEIMALQSIKSQLDDFIVKGVDNAFIVGDENIIKELLQANRDYRRYIGLSGRDVGKTGSEKAANNILKKLTDPGLDADAVVNQFFGHAKFNPASTMRLVLEKIKANIPKQEFQEVLALVKDGVLTRAFSGSGAGNVTRTNIINNYNQTFKRNKELVKMLFSEEELKQIKSFKDNVLPTLWSEINLNPSNSGNLLLFAKAQKGLLNWLRVPLSKVTFGATEALDPASYSAIRESGEAYDAVKGYLNRRQSPLFTSLVQGSIRAEGPGENQENNSEIIEDLGLNNIPDALKQKIMSATN